MKNNNSNKTQGDSPQAHGMEKLYTRPGVLFRRAHQIAVGIFMQEAAEFRLTPPQHSIMFTIGCCPGLNQSEVARALGFDRATTGQIITGLEARGLVERTPSAASKRKNALQLTLDGARTLRVVEEPSQRSSKRLLSPLSADEQRQLIVLITKLTSALNEESRTPLTPLDAEEGGSMEEVPARKTAHKP